MKRCLILTLLIFSASTAYAKYEVINIGWIDRWSQPSTIDAAVKEIKDMVDQNYSRWRIARRVAYIADVQIINANDDETMRIPAHWVPWPFRVNSTEEVEFDRWRYKDNGAQQNYTRAAEYIWEKRFGACAENSALVYYILKKAGINDLRIFAKKQPDHRFVVWGMTDLDADPWSLASWKDEFIVPDSWSHEVVMGTGIFYDKYHGGIDKNIIDVTEKFDPAAKKRCGFEEHPCCDDKPPCRGKPDLACFHDLEGKFCYKCGAFHEPCCEGDKCDAGLECRIAGKDEKKRCGKLVSTTSTTASSAMKTTTMRTTSSTKKPTTTTTSTTKKASSTSKSTTTSTTRHMMTDEELLQDCEKRGSGRDMCITQFACATGKSAAWVCKTINDPDEKRFCNVCTAG